MVVFEVEIYLIELSPWSYNSSLRAVLSFSVPINNHDKNLIIDDLCLMTMLIHSEREIIMIMWLTRPEVFPDVLLLWTKNLL